MMFSEYGFIFAVALMATELSIRTIQRFPSQHGILEAVTYGLQHKHTLRDAGLVTLFLLLYIGFRIFFPSTYEGNQLAQNFELPNILNTLYGHVTGGTSLATFARNGQDLTLLFKNLSLTQWGSACGIAAATYISSYLILCKTGAPPATHQSTRYWLLALFALCFSVFVTLHLEATSKSQRWCREYNICHFLDSRVAYLGIGVMIAALISGALFKIRNKTAQRTWAAAIFSLSLAFLSLANFLSNKRTEADMRNYVAGWELANGLICVDRAVLEEIRPKLPSILDRHSRISFHPNFDIENYWATYILDRSESIGCKTDSHEIPKPIESKHTDKSAESPANFYFVHGWSSPESWGTWATGQSSSLLVPVPSGARSIHLNLKAYVSSQHPTQRVEIKVNGVLTSQVELTLRTGNQLTIPIPLSARKGIKERSVLLLHFSTPDAISPKKLKRSKDTRRLSVGLQSIGVGT
jgi:cytochrome bd-type quinol oxidase subunit 2